MLLDALTFFGTAIVAAVLARCFGSNRRRRGGLLIGVFPVCLGFGALAFSMPFRSAWLELLLVVFGTLALAMIMGTLGVGASLVDQKSKAGCLVFPIFACLPFVSFTLAGRVHHAQQLAQSVEGMVSYKYRSHNHNVPAIAVTRDDGSTVVLEGVDKPMWDAVVSGKSRLKKPAWSARGQLDGQEYRVVPRGYGWLLGPFPD
jgi:hypothetical protein